MSKRAYNKKSGYWGQPRKQIVEQQQAIQAAMPAMTQKPIDVDYQWDESNHFTALAACGGGDGSEPGYRDGQAPTLRDTVRYKNIRQGLMPFDIGGGGNPGGYYSVSGAISLVTQAYYNVAILRNAINLLQDFSISPLHIKSANSTVKRFFTNWFESINLQDLMAQFFLEYYRSGNVFIYKFEGRIPEDEFNKLKVAISAKTPVLPIRYIILNPMQVYLQAGVIPGSYNFSKMLSKFEILRLRNPQTPEDKLVLKSFPQYIQDQIKNFVGMQYIYAPLDQNRLFYAFYRKQDYEPMAVPMAFPVLADIEYKLELKRMDMALARTIEHVILLVTTGEKADQYNPGLNPKNVAALQNIFKNQTIGRVLVADYSTKAEWKIPDLKELLGKAKYEAVNSDIQEGLQYMFFGAEKFANASIKAKIFTEGLREGRRAFLQNFLMPEVKKVCEAMNFKNVPTLEFEEINIQDNTARDRMFYQMAQIGLLTNDELYKALETGVLPDKDESLENQKTYKDNRHDGLYFPLVGGTPIIDAQNKPITPAGGGPVPNTKKPGGGGSGGRPVGTGSPMPNKKVSPIGTKRAGFSQKSIIEGVAKMNLLEEEVSKALKKNYKVKGKLTEGQQEIASSIAKSIILNEEDDKWNESVASYVKNPKDLPSDITQELDNISIEYDVDSWTAIVLWKSKIEQSE